MTQSTARAAWKAGIWSVLLVIFMALFFSSGGAEGFAHDRARIVAVAVLFAAGYAAFFVMMWLTGRRRGEELLRDERDERLESRAAGITLTAVLIYVFFIGITLWAVFQDDGSVPAGWMWFLAYSTVFIGMIAHGVMVLLLAAGRVGDGKG